MALEQVNDKTSTHAFYRNLTVLRKQHRDIFIYGDYECLDVANPHTHVFLKRSTSNEKNVALVALNFTAEERAFELPAELHDAKLELAIDTGKSKGKGPLAPYEARVYIASA